MYSIQKKKTLSDKVLIQCMCYFLIIFMVNGFLGTFKMHNIKRVMQYSNSKGCYYPNDILMVAILSIFYPKLKNLFLFLKNNNKSNTSDLNSVTDHEIYTRFVFRSVS